MEQVNPLSLWIYLLIIVLVGLRVLSRNKTVGVTLAWLLLLIAVPIAGAIFYLIVGERYLGILRAGRAREMFLFYAQWIQELGQHGSVMQADDTEPAKPLWDQTYGAIRLPAFDHNALQILDNPDQILNIMLDDIKQAEHSLLMEFYILDDDGRIKDFLAELINAVNRGVEVRIILDSAGSRPFLRSKACKQLIHAGIQIAEALYANPLRFLLRRQDLRMHRKILVIDGQVAYTGSMNIADPKTFKKTSGVGEWIDLMVRIEGPTARILQGIFLSDWEMETGERPEHLLHFPSHFEFEPGVPIQVVPSGPAFAHENLLQLLLTALYNAKHSVDICTPYFVPDDALVLALKAAAQRGVRVRIYLPSKNDSKLAKHAGRSFYSELMQSGVQIHRFEGGLLHSKCVLIDQQVVLVGTVNLDMRSIWLNFELTLVISNKQIADELADVIGRYDALSEPIHYGLWLKRGFHRKLLEQLARLLSPLL